MHTSSAHPRLAACHHRSRLLPWTFIALLLTASCAQAQINLQFEESGDDLIVSWSGSWDVDAYATGIANDTSISASALHAYTSGYGYYPSGFATPFPWSGSFTASSVEGTFGFDATSVYGPIGFTSGTLLTGSMTFTNVGYADLGLTLSDTGSFSGTSGTVNWSVGASAVPEPSTYAALLGAAGLLFAAVRRRGHPRAPNPPAPA